MDATPVIEGVRLMEAMEKPRKSDDGRLYLGSIDPITAANWKRESGHKIGTKEFAAYAKKKLMSGEFSHFKAKHRRRYV